MTKENLDNQVQNEPEEIEKTPGFFDRFRYHRFFLVRAIFYILYSVWLVVMFIGMLIAWLFTWILA